MRPPENNNDPERDNRVVLLGRDKYHILIPTDNLIYAKRGGGEKRILSGKWWLNSNTPVGDPADLFERMPHNGYRPLDWDKLVGVERLIKDRID